MYDFCQNEGEVIESEDGTPSYESEENQEQAPVPGKPISANRGLNIANRRINFIPLLDSVPEFTINLNLGVN